MNTTRTQISPARRITIAAAALAIALPACVDGQSLSDQLEPAQAAPLNVDGTPAPSPVQRMSLVAITPPVPRVYQKHDLIEVIINETSIESFEQTLDTEKTYDIMAALVEFPSIRNLLEAQLKNGDSNDLARLNITSDSKFEGEGESERENRVQSRLTATVLDVKPNGTLVLEARESIQSDEEISTMVLSGICRQEDVTRNNTIESSQLADFNLKIEHSGQVKKAAEKGIIPRVLETIFNF